MKPFSTFTERVDQVMRLAVPYYLMGILLLLNIVSVSYSLTGIIKAPFFLMSLYYWAIYRPTLVPAWLAFIAGYLLDLLTGTPPGLNALAFVAVQWFVADQRRYLMGQSFSMIWVGFAVVVLCAFFIQWCLLGFLEFHVMPVRPLIFSWAFGVALFPFVCVLLHLTHKILPSPDLPIRLRSQG